MTDTPSDRPKRGFTDEELQDLVASTDSGARNPRNRAVALLIAGLALFWSLFQIWVAEPQFWFGELPFVKILGSDQTRPMHLALALALAFLAYPAGKSSPRDRVPLYDWVLAIVAAAAALYIFGFTSELARTARSGLPTDLQIWIGAVGVVVLLEASRRRSAASACRSWRSLSGLQLFRQGLADPSTLIAPQGRSSTSINNTQWLSTGGCLRGTPLWVVLDRPSSSLFVLFCASARQSGVLANYFIQMAFAGPRPPSAAGRLSPPSSARAATGLISGSSIANVVTTGTVTIPLMKRVGLFQRKGRRGRGRLLRQRPDSFPPFFDWAPAAFLIGWSSRHLLSRVINQRPHPRRHQLHRAGLHRAISEALKERHARPGRVEKPDLACCSR